MITVGDTDARWTQLLINETYKSRWPSTDIMILPVRID